MQPEQITEAEIEGHHSLGRRFWMLWTATFASGIGDGVVIVAAPLAAARLTDSAIAVSGLAVAATLPWLLVGLQAGVIADRADRRTLMALLDVLRGVAVTAVALSLWAGSSELIMLYAATFTIGCAYTAFSAAATATIPDLVPESLLGRANGRLYAAEVASEQTGGQALGGVLFAAAASLPFLVDAASFAVSALLLLVAIPRRVGPVEPTERVSILRDVAASVRLVRGDEVLRLLAVSIAVLAGCQAMAMSSFVLFALGPVGLHDRAYGLLFALVAAGALVGGLAADRVDRRFGSAVTLAGCGVASAAGYVLIALTARLVPVAIGLTIEGSAVAIGNVSSVTLRQRITPPERLGASSNVIRVLIFSASPVAALAGGFVAQHVSLRAPMLAAAAIQIPVTLLLAPALIRRVSARVPAGVPAAA